MNNPLLCQILRKNKRIKYNFVFIFMIIAFSILGSIYIKNTWTANLQTSEDKAMKIALAAESGFQKSAIRILTGDASDFKRPEYNEIKHNLITLAKQSNVIDFAYIYKLKDDNLVLLATSDQDSNNENSVSRQKLLPSTNDFLLPFKNGEIRMTKAYSDNNGNWTSALVPMKDAETGEIIAVFAVDYMAQYWSNVALTQTIQAGLVIFCLFILLLVLFFSLELNLELGKEKKKVFDADIKLKDSETLFKAIFNQATIGIAIGVNDKYISTSKDQPSVNAMMGKIVGRTKEELKSLCWADITHPDDLANDLALFKKFQSGEIDGYDLEKRYIKPDGTEVWVKMIISALKLEDNKDYTHLCIVEDISKRKEIENALRNSERSLAVLLDNLPGMAYRCKYDHEWTMLFVSQGCYNLTGYNAKSLLNNNERSFNDLIVPKYREHLWDKWTEALEKHEKIKEEYELITANGDIKWVWEQGQGVYDENGNVVALEGLVIDITERKNQEMQIKSFYDHDYLTGLYNRRYFEETITNDMQKNKDEKRAVLLVNLRKFGTLNVTFGYQYGEKVIKEMSRSLSMLCRFNCSLFHISNDRFIYYVKNYNNAVELAEFCDSINDILSSEITLKPIGYNIGIVEIDHNNETADTILRNATIAAENVSDNQIFGYSFFDRKMEAAIMRREIIKNDLSHAADETECNTFYLEYQPILNLKNYKIHGFEALARLISKNLGSVSPSEFIAIAEKDQLIVPLGKRIMLIAFEFLKQLETLGYNDISVAINISAMQLLSTDFLQDLTKMIDETHINPYHLCFELTETVFSDNFILLNENISKIKELGIKFAIDDFGTGYSSFSRERELNVDQVKIDKYFIDKLAYLDDTETITADIISMAHKLGHEVVAEGVECEKQKLYLIKHGSDYMQGYHFSTPISKEAALNLLLKTES